MECGAHHIRKAIRVVELADVGIRAPIRSGFMAPVRVQSWRLKLRRKRSDAKLPATREFIQLAVYFPFESMMASTAALRGGARSGHALMTWQSSEPFLCEAICDGRSVAGQSLFDLARVRAPGGFSLYRECRLRYKSLDGS
jgi:hypothetical protein